MESSGETGDDQGSGWLEVKKKHRSNSKFSLQGWVAGFPGKQGSRFLHSQSSSNVKAGTSHASCDGPPFGLKQESANGSRSANYAYAPNEEGVGVHYLDKCVVSQGNKCSSSLPSGSLNGVCSDLTTGYDLDIPQNDNPGVLPKFKWGDLDDDAQEPHIGCPNGVDEIGGSGNVNMVARKLNDGDDPFSCISSGTEPKENKLVLSTQAGNISKQSLSSESRNECSDEECKEVKEVVSLEDTQVKIVNETVGNKNGDVHECSKDTNNDQLGSIIEFDDDVHCAATKEATITLDSCGPALSCEAVTSENSVAPILNEGLNSVVVSAGSDSAYEKTSLEISRETTVIASIEDSGGQQASSILEDLSKGETMTATTAGDAGESKERFRQRLWCFLFENLNRAVDELYLLCELECDEEQMKEAVLVLEEAASDFKELNSRVEDFEKVKRSFSQSSDGPSKTMKSEHRRPHALSWEVRRMTTSPRRAEILSSSIEAFKKIHQERAVLQELGKQGLPYNGSTSAEFLNKNTSGSVVDDTREPAMALRKQTGNAVTIQVIPSREKKNIDLGRPSKTSIVQSGRSFARSHSATESISSKPTLKENADAILSGKSKKELAGPSEMEKVVPRKDKMLTEGTFEKNLKSVDNLKRHSNLSERDKDRKNDTSGIFSKSMDAWKQKRNWEDILASPFRASSRYSYSPGMSRRSVERARNLHDKLMSPEKKKKTLLDLKKEAEEKHARAMRIRSELENERLQKLQRSSKKLNRVSEWQAVRSTRLREGMHARHQRGESRHEAYLAQVARRAGDESSKVNEVRFITSLNEENKKLMLLQKHQDSELRRAEKLKDMKTKQKEDMAREEAVLERKKLIEAEKLQRLAETQRKKEEAQLRREEERKASSAAREAKAIEQMRRKEIRAKAQQEEAELLAQRLAERLSESEQRRKVYLEQIRERASMDFRDQSSPLLRRSMNKESQGKSPTSCGEDDHINNASSGGDSFPSNDVVQQNSLKRRIKKIRQRLMALKYELPESSFGTENGGIGYRAAVGTARAKIGRWIQELQRHRQARKEGAASIGLVTAEMIKFLDGKEPELQASRQAGLLDFISSALPASHTSKPEACQVTIYLLRLLRVILSISVNRSYFIAQNLLPPIIPMLAAALENFIKLTASSNVPSSTNSSTSKTSIENSDSISEVLDGFLWVVAAIIGYSSCDERQLRMQDGLLELVIAYQVIHRLRDLFALYDRPQVEGSPFPSSILLSINLLVVLTSKFRTVSSIDWQSFPIEIMRVNETQEPTATEVAYLGNCPLLSSSEKFESSISALTGSTNLVLPDVPEDQPLDQTCQVKENNDTTFIHEAGCAPDELQRTPKETKPTVSKKDEKNAVDFGAEPKDGNKTVPNQPVAYLLSALSETGLVCLPSLLTAVLLQANNKLSSEQASYVLPSNFEETATGVLKVLNNLAIIDISFIQKMLARADLKMEFFHFMSFLLSHCTSKWGVATDQTGLLLLESLLLLGSFALFHPENQAVLRWGKSPTILHKVCDLPFVFFSDPELMPVLAGTLVAACFGCEQNKGLIQQELSIEMLLSLLKSCRNFLPSSQSCLASDYHSVIEESPESKKLQGDTSQRSNRYNIRSGSRTQSVRGNSLVNGNRSGKTRNVRDIKGVKVSEEMKPNVSSLETSTNLMLHSRFPGSFIDKAEQFFSAELPV